MNDIMKEKSLQSDPSSTLRKTSQKKQKVERKQKTPKRKAPQKTESQRIEKPTLPEVIKV